MRFRISYYILFVFSLLWSSTLSGQGSDPVYWLEFTDKDNTPYSINAPEEFLSQRAIDRRERLGIAIDEKDLPVDPVYLESLEDYGVSLINVSKWFNGAMVEVSDPKKLAPLENASFIKGSPRLIKPHLVPVMMKSGSSSSKLDLCMDLEDEPYGYSFNQIDMLDGQVLHQAGFRGEGMMIAVLDAGFDQADSLSSLQHIWNSGRILGYRSFVKDNNDIFESHNHGSQVFSIIGGIEEGILYGTAPEADFLLVRTEDGASEYPIEEYNWICGAEYADSMGADIINSSLGYSEFDDTTMNYSVADMDGKVAPISLAADIAASKGIIVVTSAGNSGADEWYYITAPADASKVVAVGATDPFGDVTWFSSRGPSADGRVKPDVCAQGLETVSQNSDGEFVYCAGTSCSSPVMAGMIACLWQSMPDAQPEDLIEYLKHSASHRLNPNETYGFGIPSFIKAYALLDSTETGIMGESIRMNAFPNPTSERLFLELENLQDGEQIELKISDMGGRLWFTETYVTAGASFVLHVNKIPDLNTGIYLLSVKTSSETISALIHKE